MQPNRLAQSPNPAMGASTLRRCSSDRSTDVLCSATFHFAPQPNCRFNADAKTGHAFGILLARFGALRASRSGAG
jgi:hypothetical protein